MSVSINSLFLCAGLFSSLSAGASYCDDMKIRYDKLDSHADSYVVNKPAFLVSPHVIGGSEREACAIVAFSVDNDGNSYDARAVSYYPGAGVGESAKLYVSRLKLKTGGARNKYYIYVYYNKISMTNDGR